MTKPAVTKYASVFYCGSAYYLLASHPIRIPYSSYFSSSFMIFRCIVLCASSTIIGIHFISATVLKASGIFNFEFCSMLHRYMFDIRIFLNGVGR